MNLKVARSLYKARNYINNSFILFLGDIFVDKINLNKIIDKFNTTNSSCVIISTKESDLNVIKKNFTVHLTGKSIVKKVIEKPKKPKSNIKGVEFTYLKKKFLIQSSMFQNIKI